MLYEISKMPFYCFLLFSLLKKVNRDGILVRHFVSPFLNLIYRTKIYLLFQCYIVKTIFFFPFFSSLQHLLPQNKLKKCFWEGKNLVVEGEKTYCCVCLICTKWSRMGQARSIVSSLSSLAI